MHQLFLCMPRPFLAGLCADSGCLGPLCLDLEQTLVRCLSLLWRGCVVRLKITAALCTRQDFSSLIPLPGLLRRIAKVKLLQSKVRGSGTSVGRTALVRFGLLEGAEV